MLDIPHNRKSKFEVLFLNGQLVDRLECESAEIDGHYSRANQGHVSELVSLCTPSLGYEIEKRAAADVALCANQAEVLGKNVAGGLGSW